MQIYIYFFNLYFNQLMKPLNLDASILIFFLTQLKIDQV